MVRSEREERRNGCIKTSRGPWLVHKTTKNGDIVTKLRYPTDKERHNNKQRERKRRSITKKIFAGLRAHGNYQLPKHADSNCLLMALCEEAGWHVDEEGNVYKRVRSLQFFFICISFVFLYKINVYFTCPFSIFRMQCQG